MGVKIKNTLIFILSAIASITCLHPVATVHAMEQLKIPSKQHVQQFFTYLKTLPLELQSKIEKLLIHDAIMFLAPLPITILSEEDAVGINSLALNKNKLVTGSYDRSAQIQIWDIYSGELLNTLEGHDQPVTCVATYADKIVTGSDDRTAIVWNIDTGQMLHTFDDLAADILSIAINDTYIAAGLDNGVVKIWNAQSYALIHTFQTDDVVFSLALHNNYVAAGLTNNTAMLWNVQSGVHLHTFTGHEENVFSVAIADNKLITASRDNTIKVWNISTYALLHTFNAYKTRSIAAYHNKLVVTDLADVKVWDTNTYTLLRTLVNGAIGIIDVIDVQGNILAVKSNEDVVGIWLLNPFEGTPENNPIVWIMQKADMEQLHFINRAYKATTAGYDLIIDLPERLGIIKENETRAQKDGRTYFSFPSSIRLFLRNALNIRKDEDEF